MQFFEWPNPPTVNPLDGERIEVIEALASLALDQDQSGRFQDPEVFHHRVARERKTSAKIAGRAGSLSQQIEHTASRRITQRSPYGVVLAAIAGLTGMFILNHVTKWSHFECKVSNSRSWRRERAIASRSPPDLLRGQRFGSSGKGLLFRSRSATNRAISLRSTACSSVR